MTEIVITTEVIEVAQETVEIYIKIMNKGHNGVIVDRIIF